MNVKILAIGENSVYIFYRRFVGGRDAGLAQLVEQRFCKPQVVGSNPIASSIFFKGEVAERSKATDCKSVGVYLRWFESISRHHRLRKEE